MQWKFSGVSIQFGRKEGARILPTNLAFVSVLSKGKRRENNVPNRIPYIPISIGLNIEKVTYWKTFLFISNRKSIINYKCMSLTTNSLHDIVRKKNEMVRTSTQKPFCNRIQEYLILLTWLDRLRTNTLRSIFWNTINLE